jgi:dihydroorotate dehydrogenase electron transfer subunit
MNTSAKKSQQTATVIQNQPVCPPYYKIRLACQGSFQSAAPGQFVTLHLPGNLTPLLRRPFSIHRMIKQNGAFTGIEILYKVVGGFTEKLSRAVTGDTVDLLGPVGNGFTISENLRNVALVGGGIGIAPLVFLADVLAEKGICPSESIVCLGGRTSRDILCQHDFQTAGLTVRTATDDGSEGKKGLVTDLLADWIKTTRLHMPDMIYACGPMPMLRAVADIARQNNLPCELSVETIMACGLGACLGCAINKDDASGKYQHVCIDGPVFNGRTLKI